MELEKSDLEKQVDRNLAISTAMVGITVAGDLIYWPISLFALPSLAVVSTTIYSASYQSLFKKRRSMLLIRLQLALFLPPVISWWGHWAHYSISRARNS